MVRERPQRDSKAYPSPTFNPEGVQIIEFHMMDKVKYYPLAALSGTAVRTIVYPMTLIRTRLQIQKHKNVYSGTFDAFVKITRQSGVRGLYDGFLVNNIALLSQMTYIFTYEYTRQKLMDNTRVSDYSANFISGGTASATAQTFQVPIDIVNQHLQMRGITRNMNSTSKVQAPSDPITRPGFGRAAVSIVKTVYAKNGIRGFYRGFYTSLAVYAPTSACWWTLYAFYTDLLSSYCPDSFPRLGIQCLGAVAGGLTSTFLSNPLDVIRARVQVRDSKWLPECKTLFKEEGIWGMFTKGVTARMSQTSMFSFLVIFGYESVKRLSLLPQYKDDVRW